MREPLGLLTGVAQLIKARLSPAQLEKYANVGARNKQTDEWLSTAWDAGDFLLVPRTQAVQDLGLEAFASSMSYGCDVDFDFKCPLRTAPINQQALVDSVLAAIKPGIGGILAAATGTGKTVLSLYCISQWKKTTAVLLHTEFLMDQWEERAIKFLGLKPEEIGRVQGSRCDFEGKKLVLVMLESVALAQHGKRDDYSEALYNWPGVIVLDEAHRGAAQMWHSAITRFSAAYRLGLTATPQRADGMEPILFAHVGPVIARIAATMMDPTIHRIRFKAGLEKPDWFSFRRNTVDNAKMVTKLSEHEGRNAVLVSYIRRAALAGRKVFVLSERLAQLTALQERLAQVLPEASSSQYIGGLDAEERTEAAKAQVIFSTYQLASEALDIPELDTLVMATPKANVQQCVGRILRGDVPGKKTPMIVELEDDVPVCRGMARKRADFYRHFERRWKVSTYGTFD